MISAQVAARGAAAAAIVRSESAGDDAAAAPDQAERALEAILPLGVLLAGDDAAVALEEHVVREERQGDGVGLFLRRGAVEELDLVLVRVGADLQACAEINQ